MIVCLGMIVGIFFLIVLHKKRKLPDVLDQKEWKYAVLILVMSTILAMLLFASDLWQQYTGNVITRNSYGGGSKKETFEVTLEGELESEPIMVEVNEREYTYEETKEMFEKIMEELDEIVLGENESFDKVEQDLNLVTSLEEYPVEIKWELGCYDVLDTQGNILETYDNKEGTLVEVRGTITYIEEQAIYVAHAMVFPKKKSSKETILEEISRLIANEEKETREDETFTLPDSIDGKEITWAQETDKTGYYILILGIAAACFIPIKKVQEEHEKKKRRQEQMMRDYPEIISQFTLLLSTGMTLKAVWMKIVQTYEEQKGQIGVREVYEEMCITSREMQGGISEKEAYERFGQRCAIVPYMKLGALLSQNLKKGSKGLTDILAMESIQAFEERKSQARKAGEEASTKLMLPMFGMLAVVLIMVIVPAFLSMQI